MKPIEFLSQLISAYRNFLFCNWTDIGQEFSLSIKGTTSIRVTNRKILLIVHNWLTYHYHDLITDRDVADQVVEFLNSIEDPNFTDRVYRIKGIIQEKVCDFIL